MILARPLAFTWPVGVAYWAVSLWIFAAELPIVRAARRAQRALPREKRDQSLRVLVGGQQVAMTVALILAFVAPSLTMRPVALAYWLGVAVLVASGVLRRHSFRMLGEDFRGAVTVRPGQPVVDRGAYRYVRHPSYLAALMMHAGIGLALTNWASLGVLVVVTTPLFVYRIGVEERALLQGLGLNPFKTLEQLQKFSLGFDASLFEKAVRPTVNSLFAAIRPDQTVIRLVVPSKNEPKERVAENEQL